MCKGAEDGGAGPRRLWRKEVIEYGIVDLGRGGGIGKGGKAVGKSSNG